MISPLYANLIAPSLANILDDVLPFIRAQREECIILRRMPERSHQMLVQSKLFRLLQPKRYGGLEADPRDFYNVQLKLSAACGSTGWTWGVVAAHAWQLALFPAQAQEDVWGNSADALLASSYAPVGKKVEVVDGGYLLTGKWDFCSGIDISDWCLLGALIPEERPEYRTFLVPEAAYRIEDNWHVSGLKGTGSKSVVLDKIFVPEYRTHKIKDGFNSTSPGNEVNTSLLYKFPFGQIFIRSIATPALGMASHALDSYLDRVKNRVSGVSGKSAVEDPAVLETIAVCRSELETLHLKLMANYDEMWQYVHQGETIPMDRRVQFKFESADSVRRACKVIEKLITSSGASVIFADNPIPQLLQDVLASRAHYGNNSVFFAKNCGQQLLGQQVSDYFL